MDIHNLSNLRQTFANSVFTHKVHELACERELKNTQMIKRGNIILVSIVLIMLVLQLIFIDVTALGYIGAALTLVELIFLFFQLSFNFEERVIEHKNAALRYMGLRDRLRLLICDIMNETLSANELINKRDALQREYEIISQVSPHTNDNDFKLAQIKLNKRGIVEGEEFTRSDEEINHFLPENLHIS